MKHTSLPFLIITLFLSACSTTPVKLPTAIHWFRDSAEQRAAYEQTYRQAAVAARSLSQGLTPQSWGVILDVDETVLDNSTYQKARAMNGQDFTLASWNEWVQQRAATLLPGVKQFISEVRDTLHGQVVLVTNRSAAQCPDTEINLQRLAIQYDRILCDSIGNGDKNSRFDLVQQGTLDGPRPLAVLLWIGDNIQDFPKLSQATPGDLSLFGVRYFVLPNPMYGSWTNNPVR